jgi:hypothetical protein
MAARDIDNYLAGVGEPKRSTFQQCGSVLPALAADLLGHEGTKGSLHSSLDQPLPPALVNKLGTTRLRELGDEVAVGQGARRAHRPAGHVVSEADRLWSREPNRVSRRDRGEAGVNAQWKSGIGMRESLRRAKRRFVIRWRHAKADL